MEMIKIARNNLMKEEGQDNITFIHGDVAQLSDLLRGVEKFDFAVCNSAFWQFSEPERVVASVRRLLKPGGIFAFNMPLWYTSGKKHLAFRRTVKRILRQHGIEATKFFRERKQKEYVRLLNKKGLFVIRDSLYGVDMGQKEREVWRRIPAFSRQWGYFKAIPPKVSAEIRREVRKMKLLPWPENKVLKSRWRLILAKTKV
jgi:SAM-dependent methyltransferase